MHSFLQKKWSWYSQWHSNKHHQKTQWLILVLVALAAAALLINRIHDPKHVSYSQRSDAASTDVVLYASDFVGATGNWSKVSDPAAAGSARLYNPNRDAAKINPAQTAPTSYFDVTFQAEAGAPYHVWLRGKADNDSWANDSVFVQFSDAVNANGSAIYRFGTVDAMAVQLEEGRDAGVQGWGWNDNDWGSLGANVYFAQTGTHTLRIQQREDGISIDQIVLSPSRYLTTSPGLFKNDTTIVAKPVVTPPPPPPVVTTLSSQDIGATALPGSMSLASGVYTIKASGTDFWDTADGFRFTSQPLNGDGTVVARVVSAVYTDDFTLAGLMIRESLNANSTHASMLVTPNGRAKFRYRTATGGSTVSVGPGVGTITLPRFVKVVRQGNNFSGYISADGSNWQLIGSTTVAMSANAYVGIAVTSHNNSVLTTAVVDQYSLAAAPAPVADTTAPTVALTAPSNGAIVGGSVNLSATASDNVGVTKVEYYQGTTLLGSSTSGPSYSVTWNTTSLANGSYGLTAKAYDAAGNIGTSATFTVTVSNVAPPAAAEFKAMHWNAYQGSRTDNQNNFDAVAAWIANLNPHVVSINETYASHALEYKNRIAQRTGVTWYANFVQSQTDGVGNLILSRLPFVSTGSYTMKNNGEYSRNIVQATVSFNGKNISFFSTHLDHNNTTIRSLQIDELKAYVQTFAEPRIVAGDFNANPGTTEINQMTQSFFDAWATARASATDAIISTAYACNEEGRTRSSILDYQFFSRGATNFSLKEARVVDTRDFATNRTMVQVLLNPLTNCDNDYVRPSDHNTLFNTYEVK